MSVINGVISANGFTINGIMMEEAPPLSLIQDAIGIAPYRTDEMIENGKPWRKFVIFDNLGLRFLYDYEIERILDVQFSFLTEKSISSPRSIFLGSLMINNTRLVAKMTDRSLPVQGEFRFVKSGGWKAESVALFINMRMSRKQLQAVNIAFLKRPRFKCEERLNPCIDQP